jgi:hypothetical protein
MLINEWCLETAHCRGLGLLTSGHARRFRPLLVLWVSDSAPQHQNLREGSASEALLFDDLELFYRSCQ